MTQTDSRVRVAINGFGRMGRLALRQTLDAPSDDHHFEIVHINDSAGDASTAAHLLQFDSVHPGGAALDVSVRADSPATICVSDRTLGYSSNARIEDGDWNDIDIVLDCTGAYRTSLSLAPYFAAGVKKVVVSAPVKDGPLNVVYGVNDSQYQPETDHIVTAASCTTNALAPMLSVLIEEFGVRRGGFTTIHALTNTQRVLDGFHKDLRRARSSASSLIPTTTGSATAIFEIFPQLRGKLDGTAVRVPIAQASLVDCTLELGGPGQRVTAEDVNNAFSRAASTRLSNVLGIEHRPLVSIDYEGERRSVVVDAPSTQVIDGSLVKLLGWYDNETGYVARMLELLSEVARGLTRGS